MQDGFVVWFTGLPSSGKTTLAVALEEELRRRGLPYVERLDGDVVREDLTRDLGFSKEDRDENIRRVGFVAALLAQNGVPALCAFVSPYRAARAAARARVPRFVEVYCRAPLEVLIERDRKGLYRKAIAGEIRGFTGVDDPYEEPEGADVVCNTDSETVEASRDKVLAYLEERQWIEEGKPREGGQVTARAGGGLSAPHGGRLVSRVASGRQADALRREVSGLPHIRLSPYGLAELRCLAIGVYSPLVGFLREKGYRSVVESMRLPDGAVWPLPITLPISEGEAESLRPGGLAALAMEDGEPVGLVEGLDVFRRDPAAEARAVFGTDDPAHPGVARLLSESSLLVGGDVTVFPLPDPAFPEIALTPEEVREEAARRGFRTLAAFQTRNPLHRAHEHLLRLALEVCDGLLLSPLMGETKEGDVPAGTRLRTYRAIVEGYLPKDRVLIASFPANMRYAGPREAVFHALCRKNYGATHFIVGRDHAGVGTYYGPTAAQEVFDRFAPEELGIVPLRFQPAFFCRRCGEMATERTCPHPKADRVELSGTALRGMLSRGELPPAEITRPEVARILMEGER